MTGYALHNDYPERSFQLERGGQWVKGKSADTFAPLGPFLATPGEIPNAGPLKMWLMVNGVSRQNSSTANMIRIFDVRALRKEMLTRENGKVTQEYLQCEGSQNAKRRAPEKQKKKTGGLWCWKEFF